MPIRSDWNDKAVFSECPTCQHLGPHVPDDLKMLRCDVCGSVFAAAETTGSGEAGTYVDVRPDEAITSSWVPQLPDGVRDGG
jgi:Rieske Fe-S protein